MRRRRPSRERRSVTIFASMTSGFGCCGGRRVTLAEGVRQSRCQEPQLSLQYCTGRRRAHLDVTAVLGSAFNDAMGDLDADVDRLVEVPDAGDLPHMMAHRSLGDLKPSGDLLIAQAGGNERCDNTLAGRERSTHAGGCVMKSREAGARRYREATPGQP